MYTIHSRIFISAIIIRSITMLWLLLVLLISFDTSSAQEDVQAITPSPNVSTLTGLDRLNALLANATKLTLPPLPTLPPLIATPKLPDPAVKEVPNLLGPLSLPVPLPDINLPSLPGLTTAVAKAATVVPCTCGVFLSGQFTKGSREQPTGFPALLQEYETPFACNPVGNRQCVNKCLEVIAKHLPNSGTIVCGTIDRDCFKERAYLWTKNCKDVWENSNMSAGREYCCKDGAPYKCPLGRP